jgi:hypothetical protein
VGAWAGEQLADLAEVLGTYIRVAGDQRLARRAGATGQCCTGRYRFQNPLSTQVLCSIIHSLQVTSAQMCITWVASRA